MNQEWEHEPDNKKFKYKGYKCEIRRHPFMKHLCGYVEVPHSHPAYGMNYDDLMNIDCHGGLTYSHTDKEALIHVIGFDCGHFNDGVPGRQEHGLVFGDGTYRNIGYVEKECRKVVNQLEEMKYGKTNKN